MLLFLVFVVLLIPAAYFTVSAAANITGTAVSCSSTVACKYVVKTSTGSGSANTTAFGRISFKLPGEAKATLNQPYSDHATSVSGYTYTMAGSFVAIDANTGKVVTGTTNTVVTVNVRCSRGCSYTYTLVRGSITFTPTNQDGTTTTVSCNPGSFQAGGSTLCTVKVTDVSVPSNIPTGTVSFSTSVGQFGTFSNGGTCTLSAGSCSVTFTPNEEQVGYMHIYVSYGGDVSDYVSTTSTLLSITSQP
ncbi:MAG: hypothetical protein OK457_08215 [Thaumarchaeota archaeon]|nr:hypothetical protein [Nitrososphaerota archaeon]